MATIAKGRLAVTAMFMANGSFFGVWASRVPAMADRHSLSPGQLGLLLLLIGIGAIASFPLAGRWADRHGAAKVTVVLVASHVVAVWAVALAPSIWVLVPALFYFGAMHGAMDVTMNAWAGEVEKRAGKPIMSTFHAMWSIGAGAAAATGYFAVRFGIDIPLHFIVVATLTGGLAVLLGRIGWASDLHDPKEGDPIFAFPRGALLLVGLVAMGSAIGEGAMGDWSALFLIETTRASEAAAALGYTAYSVAMVTVRLLGSGLVARFGPVATARTAGLTAGAGALLAVSLATYSASIIGFAMMGLGYALIIPLAFSRAANDPVVTPGRAIASVSTLGYGGILMGPPIIGFVAELTSVRFAFLVLVALAGLVVGLAGALRRD